METPSFIRTKKCGLPPLLPFHPGSTQSLPSDAVEQVWNSQLKEQEFMDNAMYKIRWILVRLQDHITSLDMDVDFQVLCDANGSTNEPPLTVFDLNQVALRLEDLPVQLDRSTFSQYLEKSTSSELDDTKLISYWIERVRVSSGWENMLVCPLKDAASDIFALYGQEMDGNQNDLVDNYLQYYAVQILRQIQHVSLPSLKQQLEKQQNHHHKMQSTQKEVANRYNTTFEQLDDYCMNVLRIESDTLPLYLGNDATIGDNAMIDAYAKDIGNCVIQPMGKEFHTLCDRFVRLLTGWSKLSDDNFIDHRKDICRAIAYHRHFIKFVSNQQCAHDHTDDMPLKTLHQFAAGSSDNYEYHGESCLSQFIISPRTRVELINDLQQLDSFLSCRKRELVGVTSRSFGHSVAEANDLEWTQFCIKQKGNTASSEQVPMDNLVGITSEEVALFKQSTQDILMQIVGDGTHAKRLRLLADAVGHESVPAEPFSLHLNLLCLKAAHLSRQLTLLDDQSKTLYKSMEEIEKSIGQTQTELKVMENRIQYIGEGLRATLS
jgi:hypothetical protein